MPYGICCSSLVFIVQVKHLKDLAEKEENDKLQEKEKRNPAYFYQTPEGFEAQRVIYKDRVERLTQAKVKWHFLFEHFSP